MIRLSKRQVAVVVVCLMFAATAQAQEPSRQSASALATASDARQAASETIIPRLIKFSGALLDQQGQALKGPVGVTFALYAQQTGGAARWVETQNIKPDANRNYTVLLGANSANGVPAELFVSGEARWLGIQVGQQPEHDRILLVSVPYALKDGDAETLGGLPASAFVTTNTPETRTLAEPRRPLLLPLRYCPIRRRKALRKRLRLHRKQRPPAPASPVTEQPPSAPSRSSPPRAMSKAPS